MTPFEIAHINDDAVPVAPRGLARFDRWELATGIFVLVVVISGNFFGDSALNYAKHLVVMTVMTEWFTMAVGAAAIAASRTPKKWKRIAALVAGIAVFAAFEIPLALTMGSYLILVQAVWILYGRLKPSPAALLSDRNLRCAGLGMLTGLCLVFAQVFLQMGFLTALAAAGMIQIDGNGGGPTWVYGIVWGAYYFEMAYWLPVARDRAMRGPI
jgi:hypothetical protein